MANTAAIVSPPVRATGSSLARNRRRAAVLFIAPATVLLLAIFVYPFVYALYVSFTQWTLGQQPVPTWAGFANYASLVDDARFLNAIFRSAVFVGLFQQLNSSTRPLPTPMPVTCQGTRSIQS